MATEIFNGMFESVIFILLCWCYKFLENSSKLSMFKQRILRQKNEE